MSDLSFEKGTECNRVNIGGTTTLFGDPKIKKEKPHTIVLFPGGSVEIARTSDNRYWVHVAVTTGTIANARIDPEGRYADAANAALRNELDRGAVKHIAFLVDPSAGEEWT